MANVDRANGFMPVGLLGGSSYNAMVQEYSVAVGNDVALFVGDPVVTTGTASVEGLLNVEEAPGSEGTPAIILGVIVGIVVDRSVAATEHPGYMPALTAGSVLVNVDPNQLYEVQGITALALADYGLYCDHIWAAGSTTTGASGTQLDTSTKSTSGNWQVIRASRRVDNELVAADQKLIVRPAETMYGAIGNDV
jgi:hypothetical protein